MASDCSEDSRRNPVVRIEALAPVFQAAKRPSIASLAGAIDGGEPVMELFT